MEIDVSTLEVKQNLEKHRFEIVVDDKVAMVGYRMVGSTIVYTHTEVPPEFEGKGVGSKLARFVLDYAQAQGYRVQAQCPFIAEYVRRHPEYQPITNGY
jgi:predicted GNAT family acetyltransferase